MAHVNIGQVASLQIQNCNQCHRLNSPLIEDHQIKRSSHASEVSSEDVTSDCGEPLVPKIIQFKKGQ